MLPSTSSRRTNFPTRPEKKVASNFLPEDLLASGRNVYTQIQFVQYNFGLQTMGPSVFSLFSGGGIAKPTGGMVLPVPRKINESQTLTWSEDSATKTGVSLASRFFTGPGAASPLAASVGNFGSATLGVRVNPYLFMYFQQPNYKEFSFSWTFAPNNARESQSLANIINQFKSNSLPAFGYLVMDYPNIALIKIHPSDLLGNLKFKPCAVTSVLVDYTGSGPSFFKNRQGSASSSGAPTVVNLTVNFKEIQLWDRREIQSSFGTAAAAAAAVTTGLIQESAGPVQIGPNGPTFSPGA